MSVRARGARRSQQRFAGRLERFTLIGARLSGPSHRLSLVEAEVLEPFLGLRSHLEAGAAAAEVMELGLLLSPPGDPQPRVFGTVAAALFHLSEGHADPHSILEAANLLLLEEGGILPVMGACGICGDPLGGGVQVFSASGGGVLCPRHRSEALDGMILDEGALAGFRSSLSQGIGGTVEGASRRGRRRALRAFMEHHFSRQLRAADFFDKVGELS